jgi:hypothetical protein
MESITIREQRLKLCCSLLAPGYVFRSFDCELYFLHRPPTQKGIPMNFRIKSAKKLVLCAALLTATTAALVPAASAQAPASPKVLLVNALTFIGYDSTGITFDLPTDAEFAADNAKFPYHLYVTSQQNGTVVAFSNSQTALKNLTNAAILLYEAGQVNAANPSASLH